MPGALPAGDGGGAAAVVIAGAPGIGKTSVWREGVRLACERGWCALMAAPSQSEAQIAFAALGDLLSGVLERVLGGLPRPQQRALEVALRVADLDPAEGAALDRGRFRSRF